MAVVGGVWLFVDILSTLKLFDKDQLSYWILLPIALFGLLIVILTRRPVKKIAYKYPGQDLIIEVRIGNLFEVSGQKIISTNTTFDTDIANGIISAKSIQGQFTNIFYSGNLVALDAELNRGLMGISNSLIQKNGGKNLRYEFGTTVKINLSGQFFYWVAMADLNSNNNAKTSLRNVTAALDGLWEFIETKGEKLDTVIPLVGTGLGRLNISRKKLIAIIAQSFINASENQIFSNKLVIVIHPDDVEKSGLNLFEVKDLLTHYLP